MDNEGSESYSLVPPSSSVCFRCLDLGVGILWCMLGLNQMLFALFLLGHAFDATLAEFSGGTFIVEVYIFYTVCLCIHLFVDVISDCCERFH